MPINETYRQRLWTLHNPSRGAGQVTSSVDLLKVLRADFEGPKELFTLQEYRDRDLRDTIVDEITHGVNHGLYKFPVELTRFVRELFGPGPILSLYSGFGEALFEVGSGVGVEPSAWVAEWSDFFAKIAGLPIRIVVDEPRIWQSPEAYQRILFNPPFGSTEMGIDLWQSALTKLSDGPLIAFVPFKFLWSQQDLPSRELISRTAQISAVISVSPNLWRHIGIRSAVVVIDKLGRDKTYMAVSKSPADLSTIATDYAQWRTGSRFSVGFEGALNPERWNPEFYEPIDFTLSEIRFPYKVVPLGELARVQAARPSSEAKIAINRTGSKTVWVADEPQLNARNYIFVTPSDGLNPSYLQLYLASDLGRRAIARRAKGDFIPHLSSGDIQSIPVIVPDLPVQNAIVKDALDVQRTISDLESLVHEGKQSLSEKLFTLSSVKQKFAQFASNTEKAFYQALPFPIAVVYRKIRNAPNNTQKFSLLIELFEVAVRFIALVHLADYINSRKQADVVAEQIPEIKKMYAPALGDWVSMFRSFAYIKGLPESEPFLQEAKSFKLDRYQKTLQEFVDIRNKSLRGHGATLTEDEYELRFQEHAPKVYKLINSLGFLANYTLVKTGTMEKDGDFYKIAVQVLMGDNPHFEHLSVELRTPLDTNRVLLLNRNQESLPLDPYIVLERCPECRRPEVLLLDKVSDKKITYLGYESGHRPALENAARLPLVIRETATRHIT